MVRATLKRNDVEYNYVDIRKDNTGRLRVKEINAGNDSNRTLPGDTFRPSGVLWLWFDQFIDL